MPVVTAPSIADLRAICEFATEAAFHQTDLAKLHRMQQWLEALENLDDASKVRMAVDTAEAAGPFEGMMAVSTSHIMAETGDLLLQGKLPITCYVHGGYGWLINVPQDESAWASLVVESVYDKIPNELFKLIDRAHDCGCSWLLLDADATVLDGFQTHEW